MSQKDILDDGARETGPAVERDLDPELRVGEVRSIPRHRVREALNPHLLSVLSIGPMHATEIISPRQLLSPFRIDVMAKYIYAKHHLRKTDAAWGTRVYSEHLRVWNDFVEGDGSSKSSFADYQRSFDELIDHLSREGFRTDKGLVPLGHSDHLIDGAHRVAAALALDCPVETVRFDVPAARYDYRYFAERGLDSDILDGMLLEYCRLDSRVRVAALFPVAKGRADTVLEMLGQWGGVAYSKRVRFTETGKGNLIRLLYRNESWLGDGSTPTPGLLHHVTNRFSNQLPVTFIFFLAGDGIETEGTKDAIRAMYGLGNDSVHINDTHQQTTALAESILNPNSIHFLNHSHPVRFRNFDRLVDQVRAWLTAEQIDCDRFCIDGSSVLSAYGLRDASDLDYLYQGSPVPRSGNALISPHNDEIGHYDRGLDDLVLDPRNHFYRDGLKFVALSRIRALKARRAESKDLGDVYRIDVLEGRVGGWGRLLAWHRTLPDRIHKLRFRTRRALKAAIPGPLVPLARRLLSIPARIRGLVAPTQGETIYRGFKLRYSRGTSLIETIHGGRVYEPEVAQRLVQHLSRSESPVLVDVGANIGLMTLNIVAEIPDARVFAFEPGPHQAQLLRETISANGLGNQVEVLETALGRERGPATFAVHRTRHASGDGFLDTHRAGRARPITVQATTMDDWWTQAGRPRVDALKIDTEGAELWILQGAERLLEARHPTIVFELHPRNLRVYPHEATDVLEFMGNHGYAVTTLKGEPATRDSVEIQMRHSNDYVATYRS